MKTNKLLFLLSLGAILLVSSMASAETVTVVASGLNNPRGIDVKHRESVVFAETGAGKIDEIRNGVVSPLAEGLPVATTPEGEITGVVGVAFARNGNVFATIGGGPIPGEFTSVIRVSPSHQSLVADIGAFQATDPDPYDTENFPTDSNPYGIDFAGHHRVVITDAANNDLLLVWANGSIEQIARFPTRLVSTNHLPTMSPPLPPLLPAEAVPTTVTVGPDGYYYVSQLLGFPFTPGQSMIWRIAPWARNAVCDDDTSDGCEPYKTGLTSVIGIKFGPDGSLYVLEIAKHGLAACFGAGDCEGGLFRIKHNKTTELAAGQLVTPGGVAVGRDGDVWVTNYSIQPGLGQVLRIDRDTDRHEDSDGNCDRDWDGHWDPDDD